jgi:hypothetical protein
MSTTDLRRVERAAAKLERARRELGRAVKAASAAGEPLRPIAKAAGVSVETVRQMIAKAP